jgi:hypothetical protein
MKRLFLLGGMLFAIGALQLNAQSATSTTSTSATQNVEQTNVSVATNTSTLPGFPVYINTGNPAQDAITYKEAKDKWISENQDLYNAELQKLNANNKEEPNQEGIDKVKNQTEKQPELNSTNH